jgi:hypothetical protein
MAASLAAPDPDLTLRVIRLVPPREGCRLPLNIGFLPLPVDPSQMAMARSLRSTGITPATSLLRSSPPLPGASVLSASRLEPLAPFPLASPSVAVVAYDLGLRLPLDAGIELGIIGALSLFFWALVRVFSDDEHAHDH